MNGNNLVRIVKLAALIQVILCLWILAVLIINGIVQNAVSWKLSVGRQLILLSFMSYVLLSAGSIGVLRGKRWGWWISVTIYLYLFYMSVQNIITLENDFRFWMSLIVSVGLLVLFFTAAIRKAYHVYRQKPAVQLLTAAGLGGAYILVMWVIQIVWFHPN